MAGVDILATAFSGGNAAYLADLYARWVDDPDSVDASFIELFAALDEEAAAIMQDAAGASWAPRQFEVEPASLKPVATAKPAASAPAAAAVSGEAIRAAADDSLRALQLIRAYRVRGHLEARLDPLGLQIPKSHWELDPASYGFGPNDRDRPLFVDRGLGRQ